MSIPVQSATGTSPNAAAVDATFAAATAAAAALPVAGQVTVDAPVAGPTQPPAGETAAVAATLAGDVSGTLVVVVGTEVLTALRETPLGELELVAGLQPTLDAAAAAVGARAQSATAVDAAQVLGQAGAQDLAAALVSGGTQVATVLTTLRTTEPARAARSNGLDLLRDVEMEVTVEIGRTRMTVRELLQLTPGTVVELDRAAGSPADLLVNGTLLARGEIVVVDEDFGIRITEIVSSSLEMDGTGR